MMPACQLTQDEVIAHSRKLPSFPCIVTEILATLDDPDGNLNVLVRQINLDPLISARVLCAANRAAMGGRREAQVSDIYTATSLIGLKRVREITLISSLGAFVSGAMPSSPPAAFWQHSVAVGVSCEELSLHITAPVATDMSLVAGLLHDIGQLWLYSFNAEAARVCGREALSRAIGIEHLERERFGIDHSTIGAWLAEHWSLPSDIVAAIRRHHQPAFALNETLAPLVHVAEVLSNALDLTGREENRVTSLSNDACSVLGFAWDAGVQPMFGRMDARSRHANSFFQVSGQ